MHIAYIPSPTQSVWDIGPVPLRAYALCIIAGIAAAIVISERRWVSRGGIPGTVTDVAVWAVIFGLVGGRLYHVATNPELYFGSDDDPVDAFKIWEGGLGIWGAIGLGAVGAWLACRRKGIGLAPFADAAAPGIAVGQAVGRIGNWFNNELYGRETDLPWRLRIYDFDPDTSTAREVGGEKVVLGEFHPTFLYELLWNLGVAGLVLWADRRFRLGRGRAFALYVMAYTAGRAWIELLRIDEANEIAGVRLNVWTSVVVFLAALAWFVTHPGPREQVVEAAAAAPDGSGAEDGAQAGEDSGGSGGEAAGAAGGDRDTAASSDPAAPGDPAEQPEPAQPAQPATARGDTDDSGDAGDAGDTGDTADAGDAGRAGAARGERENADVPSGRVDDT